VTNTATKKATTVELMTHRDDVEDSRRSADCRSAGWLHPRCNQGRCAADNQAGAQYDAGRLSCWKMGGPVTGGSGAARARPTEGALVGECRRRVARCRV
jgi:hypothetical protein